MSHTHFNPRLSGHTPKNGFYLDSNNPLYKIRKIRSGRRSGRAYILKKKNVCYYDSNVCYYSRMPKLSGVRRRVKLMSDQEDLLKKICCDDQGATGCKVSLGNAAALLRLGVVRLAPTRAGIEYLTGSEILTPAQVEGWIHGMKVREGRMRPQKLSPRQMMARSEAATVSAEKSKKQKDLEAVIAKAEEADRIFMEQQRAAFLASRNQK